MGLLQSLKASGHSLTIFIDYFPSFNKSALPFLRGLGDRLLAEVIRRFPQIPALSRRFARKKWDFDWKVAHRVNQAMTEEYPNSFFLEV
jgi:hypothetical protein